MVDEVRCIAFCVSIIGVCIVVGKSVLYIYHSFGAMLDFA
jgi:hypothetical protein